jgi:hypothetical protein
MSTTTPAETPGLSPADWDRVHELVQHLLGELAQAVARQCPQVVSRPGRTTTQRFPLFSYRTFSRADREGAEAIVAGVDFKPEAGGLRVFGDISGEESGQVYYGVEYESLPAGWSLDQILARVRIVAGGLAGRPETVWNALAPAPHNDGTIPPPTSSPEGLMGEGRALK